MARITTVTNQKGGVGKTTTAHALAAGLHAAGYHVLMIDTDGQANLSDTAKADPNRPGLYELLETATSNPAKLPQQARQAIQRPGIDLIAASDDLDGIELAIANAGDRRAFLLRQIVATLTEEYDHIIIDTPPTLGLMTINALAASNDIVIPIKAEIYALRGFAKLEDTIAKTREYYNPALKVAGLLVTMYNPRTILTRSLYEDIQRQADRLNAHIYGPYIRQGIAIGEAQTLQRSIFDYAPKSNPAADYAAFVKEYLAQEGNNRP